MEPRVFRSTSPFWCPLSPKWRKKGKHLVSVILLYFTRCVPSTFTFCLSFIITPILSSTHISFYFTNHFLVIILLLRSLTSGSFITCPSSTFSPSLIWHFCHQQANTSISDRDKRPITPINILDRCLDSPTLLSSHSFRPYLNSLHLATLLLGKPEPICFHQLTLYKKPVCNA